MALLDLDALTVERASASVLAAGKSATREERGKRRAVSFETKSGMYRFSIVYIYREITLCISLSS